MSKKLVILLFGEHLSGKSKTWRALLSPTESPSSRTNTAYHFVKRLRRLLLRGGIGINQINILTNVFIIDKSPEEAGARISDYFSHFKGKKPSIVLCSTRPDDLSDKKRFFEGNRYQVEIVRISKPSEANEIAEKIRKKICDWVLRNA